jgi:hypothetical protein
MTSTTPTLTYVRTGYSGPQGTVHRRVPISLPFVSFLADDPRYAARPSPPEPERLSFERGPRLTEKLIRRTLGKDRTHSAKLRRDLGYVATMKRIERDGA